MRKRLDAWRDRSRPSRIADASLAATIFVLASALVVNAIADVHTTRRVQVDQRVMTNYLIDYAGGPAPFGAQAYVAVHHGSDLVCAFLRHANGGLCLKVASTTTHSRRILREYACINLPPAPKHVKHWRPPRPPKGQHWCPWHPKKVI